MSETINNSATAIYSLDGTTSNLANSNVLPLNFDNSQGLSITKSSNVSTFSAGSIITYTITVTNNSPYFFTGVRIIDNLGGGNLAYVLSSASLTASGQTYPVTPIATNPLTFTLQQLSVGATMTLTYKCQVIFNLPTTVSLITNTVQGIGYTSTGTVTGFANNTIQKKNSVEFSLTKTSNVTDVRPNQTFNYYLTLTNNTSNTANVSSLTDQLPSNFNVISVKLKIGNNSETTLNSSDYNLSTSNVLQIPSATGPMITVPANGTTIATITGYFV